MTVFPRPLGLHALGALLALPACRNVPPPATGPAGIRVTCALSAASVPAGAPVSVRYTWTVLPHARRLERDYAAFVHLMGPSRTLLFGDDHVPSPPPSSWQAGRRYAYTRTVLIPYLPLPVKLEMHVGLFASSGGERLFLEGQDKGQRAYGCGSLDVQAAAPDGIAFEGGFHRPEAPPEDPFVLRRWMRREGAASFLNPGKDVIVFIKGETDPRFFETPPTLTLTVGDESAAFAIRDAEGFVVKARFPSSALGPEPRTLLRLAMSGSFVPRASGLGDDARELSLRVHHLYVGAADDLAPELQEGAVLASAAPPAEKGQ